MSVPRHRNPAIATDYAYLLRIDAAGLAWEWLRRNPAYRQLTPALHTPDPMAQCASNHVSELVAPFGALTFVPVDLDAGEAPIIWSRGVDASVLQVAAMPALSSDAPTFNLDQCRRYATIAREGEIEHVLVRHDGRHLRFDVCAGTVLRGPVRLFVDAMAFDDASAQAIRHLGQFQRPGRIAAPGIRADREHLRQIAALRTFDAFAEGASIRGVAIALFGQARVEADWLDPGDSLKSHCRRLIALARQMADGGYLRLLASKRTNE